MARILPLYWKIYKKTNVLRILDEQNINKDLKNEYDIIINIHGDIDPYYSDNLYKNNAITYCHFPSAKFLMENEDKAYLEKHLKINRASSTTKKHTAVATTTTIYTNIDSLNMVEDDNNIIGNFDRKRYLKWLKDTYDEMMQNTTLLTNSEYSRKAIFDTYGIKDCIVLYPPVDNEKFCSLLFSNDDIYVGNYKREDTILVISRIDPSKEIENAIKLSRLLKSNGIGKEMIVVGSLDPYFNDYYLYIKEMILTFDLKDYIKFEINVSFDKLLSLMKKSKVYFHPSHGKHFGILIVEAMSAGLIPIVAYE